jgi:hypothetical protein
MIAPQTEIICSFVLTFGVPMALAVREYWQCAASPGHLPPGEPVSPRPTPLPDAGAGPTLQAPKKLPDCLIPQRVRELA